MAVRAQTKPVRAVNTTKDMTRGLSSAKKSPDLAGAAAEAGATVVSDKWLTAFQ
jgi:hypothetical protein